MKNTIILLLIAFTITNGIFIFLLNESLTVHEETINRQGWVLSELIATPEIQSVIARQVAREQVSSTTQTVTK